MASLTQKAQKGFGAVLFFALHRTAVGRYQIPTVHINQCNREQKEKEREKRHQRLTA